MNSTFPDIYAGNTIWTLRSSTVFWPLSLRKPCSTTWRRGLGQQCLIQIDFEWCRFRCVLCWVWKILLNKCSHWVWEFLCKNSAIILQQSTKKLRHNIQLSYVQRSPDFSHASHLLSQIAHLPASDHWALFGQYRAFPALGLFESFPAFSVHFVTLILLNSLVRLQDQLLHFILDFRTEQRLRGFASHMQK